MASFIVEKLNSAEEPLTVEADGVEITSDGKVTFTLAAEIVAQFVNVNFYPAPDPAP